MCVCTRPPPPPSVAMQTDVIEVNFSALENKIANCQDFSEVGRGIGGNLWATAAAHAQGFGVGLTFAALTGPAARPSMHYRRRRIGHAGKLPSPLHTCD